MVFSSLNQSFSFHSSPESFISSRLQELSLADAATLSESHGIAQASILNRNVHIISSYKLCREILDGASPDGPNIISAGHSDETINSDTFSVGPAYNQLMSEFFPPPNLLLEDGELHQRHKAAWKEQIRDLPDDTEAMMRNMTKEFIREQMKPGTKIDLYEALKGFAWDLLLGVFLGLDKDSEAKTFCMVEEAQENLLRGQFSLFPVSLSTPFWQSARNKGLKARKDLQTMLMKHITNQNPDTCPVLKGEAVDRDDVASHCLLFTSSIANKAAASLLTASIMNLFLMPGQAPLAELIRAQPQEERQRLLKSILLETERLSPPVIGVMRRAQQDVEIKSHWIAKGHDLWLYFSGASRDPEAFEDPDSFQFDRFMHENVLPTFAFSSGPKTCLGTAVIRRAVMILSEEMINSRILLRGDLLNQGVRQWLGWDERKDPKAIAEGLKQLPCQRPREPIVVSISESETSG